MHLHCNSCSKPPWHLVKDKPTPLLFQKIASLLCASRKTALSICFYLATWPFSFLSTAKGIFTKKNCIIRFNEFPSNGRIYEHWRSVLCLTRVTHFFVSGLRRPNQKRRYYEHWSHIADISKRYIEIKGKKQFKLDGTVAVA